MIAARNIVVLVAFTACGGRIGDGSGPSDAAGETSTASDGGASVVATFACPAGFALDESNVYWLDAPCSAAQNGRVLKCGVASCDASTVLASGRAGLTDIVVDATNVYWTEISSGRVMTCPIAGCNNAPVVLALGKLEYHSLAIDDANVYWGTTNGDILKCSTSGCDQKPTRITTGPVTPSFIAVDSDTVFWSAGLTSDVMSCPKTGCDVPTTLATHQNPKGVAYDSTNVYWTTLDGVVSCAKTGCNQTPSTFADVFIPEGIARMNADLYWASLGSDKTPKPGGIMRCPLSGCNGDPTVLVVGGVGTQHDVLTHSLAVNSTSMYWLSDTALMRASLH